MNEILYNILVFLVLSVRVFFFWFLVVARTSRISRYWNQIFPPGLTFLASVFGTFLTRFSDLAFPGMYLEEFKVLT